MTVNISFLSNTAKKMILKNYIKYRYILYSNNIIAYEQSQMYFVNNIHICIILYDYTILKYVCCIMRQDKNALNRYISIAAAYKIKVIK